MRLIGRALLALCVLALAAMLVAYAWPRVALYLAGGSPLAGDDVRTSVAYVLPPGRDVVFVLDRQPSRARISVAAMTSSSATPTGDAAWRIAWAAFDEQGATLGSGEFGGGCRAPATYRDPSGDLHPVRWSTDPALAPCADQLLFLRFAQAENAARIRLRLIAADPAFRHVTARVSKRVARSARGRDVAWHRLSEGARNELASLQAWPAWLLSPGEVDAVLANQWEPVGPQGVAGTDFDVLTLAWLPADAFDRNPETSGITRIADAGHRITLPVYEHGELVLRLAPADGVTQAVDARVTLHPTLPLSPETMPVRVPREGMEWMQRVDRGLLEVESAVPLAVEVLAADGATMQHGEHRQRLLRLTDGTHVDWPVTHARGMTTALRLDVRGIVEPAGLQTGEHDALAWQWLDAAGRVLRSGTLAPLFAPSPYDRPGGEGIVTDPASAWFRLPPEVATVRAIAQGTLLAGAWTRVDDATLPRRVPAEQRGWFDDPRRMPEWFPLDTADQDARIAVGGSELLRIQHRPLPPVRLGADTLVDVMAPREPSALAARILLPLSAVPARLAPPARSLYAPVDTACRATFTGNRGEARVTPQLLFTGGKGLAPATVVLDGLPLDVPSPAGDTGVIDLPPVAAGLHRLCVDDPAGRRWYASHATARAAQLVEAGGYRIETGQALTFDVRKEAAPLSLAVRWYGGAPGPVVLEGAVEGLPSRGAFAGYTMPRTQWMTPGSTSLPGSVLYRAGKRASAPQSMSITLDADLPAGTWRVRIRLASGAGGWLGVSRLEYAGDGATRALYEVP